MTEQRHHHEHHHHEKERVIDGSTDEEKIFLKLCADLDEIEDAKHFLATESDKHLKIIVRTELNGICFIDTPDPANIGDVKQYDQQLDEAKLYRYAACTGFSAEPEKRTFLFTFLEGKPLEFSVNNYHELHSIIKDGLRRAKPEGARTDFEVACQELDKFVHSHHMHGRDHVHTHNLTNILGAPLVEMIGAVQAQNRDAVLLGAILSVLISPVFGAAVAASSSMSSSNFMDGVVVSEIRKKYVHAKKHGYMYFKSTDPEDKNIYYYKDFKFGVARNPHAKAEYV